MNYANEKTMTNVVPQHTPHSISQTHLDWFADTLGPKGFTRDAHDMAPWLTDWRGMYHGAAAAMLSPANTQEVSDVISYAATHGLCLVPQGGNSGMSAGATPDVSGLQLILSLRRMNTIRTYDVAARQIVADAGVILQHLHDAVEAKGLRFPLTLGGKGSATIGGLVSTNAGGTQVLRHGNMRALVLGIEAVLPDGSILDTLTPLKKDNRGYDMTQLLVGAEGTLGIITAATLKLVPAIAQRSVAWVAVDSPHAALALLHHVEADLGPALEGFEIIPQTALDAVLRHMPDARSPVAAPSAWHVLIETVAQDMAIPLEDRLLETLGNAAEAGMLADAVIAKHEAEAEAFWAIRDGISEAERVQGPALQHDVSVPVSRMPDYIIDADAQMALAFPGARILAFGHLGDGNVHHHVKPPLGEDGQAWIAAHGDAASRHIYGIVQSYGGSISAEHGIGATKAKLLPMFVDAPRLAAMRAIKAALDPQGILNPGKLLISDASA